MSTTRDQIIEAMCDLLELQGYHATGLNELIKVSGAPRGSLYYYFPDGKDGLTVEAIARTGKLVAERIRRGLAVSAQPGAAVRAFVEQVAAAVEASGFRAGGPLTAVAMETATTNERLNEVCREAFAGIQATFAERLRESGVAAEPAGELATFITAAIEGGIILCRTNHSGEPLRVVARQLERLIGAGQDQ
jgi:TetR/AcrR family transcriptional repressor of lmrAB and yxaGH operons